MEAEEPDEVGAVGVEVLAAVGAVEAHAGVDPLDAFVPDVTEQGGLRVLTHRRAEVQTEAHVGQFDVVLVEPVGPGRGTAAAAGSRARR